MDESGIDAAAGRARSRRWWGGALAAALLLHGVALGGLDGWWPRPEVPGVPRVPLEVRIVTAGPETRRETPTGDPAVEPATARPRAPTPPVVAATRPVRPRAQATTEPRRMPANHAHGDAVRSVVFVPELPSNVAVAALTPPSTGEGVAAAAPEPLPPTTAALPDAEPLPHYRTRVPPSVTLRYDVRRGALSGVGEIDWHNDGSHYELRLDFRYAGLSILQQTSSGGFDAAGLAPLRFVDQRLRRAAQAANFRRDLGRLSYSGSGDDYPLRPGTQDRLSWMVQLAAIVAADPALAQPGGRVSMAVTGARGDLAVWTFRSLGPETLELRSGRVEAVKFLREARQEHDITVQAWLDPGRGYLPVSAFQQSGPADEAYELRLIEAIEAH